MDERAFSELVGKIYDAATDPAQMARLAATLAHAFERHSAILYLHKRPRPSSELVCILSATDNYDEAAFRSYAQYYHAHDEWLRRGIKKPLGWVNIGNELIDDGRFERTEFYNDWCRSLDAFRVLGTSVQLDGEILGSMGIQGSRQGAPFHESNRKQLALLLPHLQRTFQIHHRLQVANRNYEATLSLLDGLSIGAIIVDKAGRVLFANAAGERALKAGRGLRTSLGRLQAERPSENPKLQRMIGEAARTSAGEVSGSGGLLRLDSRCGEALRALIAPLRTSRDRFGAEQPAALITFSDAQNRTPIEEGALAVAFGLTPAEARLAAALAGGESLSDYADRSGISRNTAKGYLKQLFSKTGTSRQAEVVRQVLLDPVLRLQARR